MKVGLSRNPTDVLNALIAAGVEVIRSRNPLLAAALDVPPPCAEHPRQLQELIAEPSSPGSQRKIYQYLRIAYRALDRVGPMRPVLRVLRSKVKQLLLSTPQSRPKAVTFPSITRSFTIAFTMRSGSNEICNLLARNGLGSPNEFFQKPLPADGNGLLLDSFARVVAQNQVGGVFGSKMSHDHRAVLDEQLRSVVPGYSRIDDLLPNHRWVWLLRKDKILQAISWCRAETSNQWALTQPDAAKSDEFGYDFLHILSRVMMIYWGELAWETYFHEARIEPLVIYYEDFFRDLDHQLPRLIDYLGGVPSERASTDKGTTLAIQRNEQSNAARQRFVSDLGRVGTNSMAKELGEQLQRWGRFFFELGWRG